MLLFFFHTFVDNSCHRQGYANTNQREYHELHDQMGNKGRNAGVGVREE
jgi:hypothetical protein